MYKKTELGLIPTNWEIRQLGFYADVTMGQSPAGYSYNQNEIGTALINGPTEFTKRHPIQIQWTTSPTKVCDENDILLCVRGSSTGRINISNGKYCIGRGIATIKSKNNASHSFLEFQVQNIVKKILSLSAGSTFPNIDGKSLKNIKSALPPLHEQRAIAQALSDIDSLINAIDALITKKRNIKQGAMQQLLTGKMRLPGFNEEWELITLGESCQFYKGKGLSKSEINTDGVYPCIHYGELFTQHKEQIINTISYTGSNDSAFFSKRNDVIMPTSDVTPNGLAKASCVKNDGIILGGDILVIRDMNEKQLNGVFLSYIIRKNKNQIMKLVSGTTVYHLYGSDMKKFELFFPPFCEQEAITKVILDMDSEIELLNQQLQKTKSLKQGMMQELLTGKTRLV